MNNDKQLSPAEAAPTVSGVISFAGDLNVRANELLQLARDIRYKLTGLSNVTDECDSKRMVEEGLLPELNQLQNSLSGNLHDLEREIQIIYKAL